MPPGLDQLKHIVVLMMENRSFDHMLGALRKKNKDIDGFPDDWTNPGPNGETIGVQLKADYRGQLTPDPEHHYPHVDQQIFNGDTSPNRVATMKGFVRNYYAQRQDVNHAAQIMYAFKPEQLPVLTTLAQQFAVFNRWFASIPGPTLCNRAFAHYGTSYGQAGMEWWYGQKAVSVYQRLIANGRTAKVYYFDQSSSSLEVPNLLKDQPALFGTYPEFLASCKDGTLPDYSFIEPNYTDHDGDNGEVLASDQHPDHHVREGDRFIGSIYNAIRRNDALWRSTALLILYDEHGGLFDHVPPPACKGVDGHESKPDETLGSVFKFDRLGVRVPAVLVSPWVPPGTVVPSTRVFEHASIPATVTEFFIGKYDDRTDREKQAETFLDLLSLPALRSGGFMFADK